MFVLKPKSYEIRSERNHYLTLVVINGVWVAVHPKAGGHHHSVRKYFEIIWSVSSDEIRAKFTQHLN